MAISFISWKKLQSGLIVSYLMFTYLHGHRVNSTIVSDTGLLLAKKTPSYWYRDSHYEHETVVKPFEVYNGDSYTHNTAYFSE